MNGNEVISNLPQKKMHFKLKTVFLESAKEWKGGLGMRLFLICHKRRCTSS